MNIYIQKNNELLAHTLQAVHYHDPMTPSIPNNAVIADIEQPPIKENQAYLVSGERNKDGHYTLSANVSVVDDYRNIDTYNKETGEREKVTEIGGLPSHVTTLKRDNGYQTFNEKTNKWTLSPAAKKQQLADSKANKLAELNGAAQSTIEAVAKISQTPEFERATWTIQAAEAVAWNADKQAKTPNLNRIAKMRGVRAHTLKRKAYKKAKQYEVLSTSVAGQRQKYEDMIFSAKTDGELEELIFAFEVG